MGIIQLSDNEFGREVLQSREPVLVDFWAPWCAPCLAITPILEELSKEYNARLKICKVNVDKNQAVAAKYQVLSIPTLLFFKDGKITNQIVGIRPASDIKKTIDSLLC
ncbi:MAG: thioredoxin [Candidatus Omnitrophica bacterium]|nr:thioredoxin [Candidatus Omnitrophota bacterium]MBU3933344.1 thioredoxin [Candidatus Omnitrophota bacterium]MBU4140696.1 thioredoxin [Candidatus Omnitrophota bacterium]